MVHGKTRGLSCKPTIYVSWSTFELRVRLAPWTGLSPPVRYFYWPFLGGTSFADHLCYLCLVFVRLSRLFIAALWSPAGKVLTSWLSFVMFSCVFVTFSCGILGQVRYLNVSIPDLCHLFHLRSVHISMWTHFGHINSQRLARNRPIIRYLVSFF